MTLDLEALETSFDLVAPRGDELGARHVAYGAEPEHYPVVGEVLLAAMADIAGSAWCPRYEQAWADAFAIVAGAMLEGAETAKLESAA
jgi:methyl-accepting chemotaxis protein